jgi:hypothetical protein
MVTNFRQNGSNKENKSVVRLLHNGALLVEKRTKLNKTTCETRTIGQGVTLYFSFLKESHL